MRELGAHELRKVLLGVVKAPYLTTIFAAVRSIDVEIKYLRFVAGGDKGYRQRGGFGEQPLD